MTRRAWVGDCAGGGWGRLPHPNLPPRGEGTRGCERVRGGWVFGARGVARDLAQARYRVNQTMDFFVEASRGHDDYLMSLALMVRAAASPARTARGRVDDASSMGR